MIDQQKPKTAQLEKELEVDLYVNRRRVVKESRFRSSIYEGEKGVLYGRPAREAAGVTSHIFGFCGGSHQQAATLALEHAWGAMLPPNAQLLRAVGLATEIIQNATRWIYTTFAPDLTLPYFADSPYYTSAVERFTAYEGTSFRRGIMGATFPMSIYALIAGQWPHADFAVPGGVNTSFDREKLNRAYQLLDRFRDEWLEGALLQSSVDDFLAIRTHEELWGWLERKEAHRESDLGLMARMSLGAELQKLGAGNGRFLTYGAFWPGKTALEVSPETHLSAAVLPGLFWTEEKSAPFDYRELLPQLQGGESRFVHYGGQGVEVGPLARMLAVGESTSAPYTLFQDMVARLGAGVFVRAFARIYEIAYLYKKIREWLGMLDLKEDWQLPVEEKDGWGLGLVEAPRGALAHFVRLENGRIVDYQILAPTLLNVQSGLVNEKPSPLQSAVSGLVLDEVEHPMEAGIIARSFDACLVCNTSLYKSSSGQFMHSVRV